MYYRTFFTVALLSLVSLTSCGNSLELTASATTTANTSNTSAQIVFSRRTSDMNSDLFVMDDTGSNLRQITETPLLETNPTWSPDGTQLAMSAISFENGDSGYHITSMRADGSERVDYTRDTAPIVGMILTWTPDGMLTYVGEPDRGIWSLDPATAAIQRLTPQRPKDWSPPYPAPPVTTEDPNTPDWLNIVTEYQDTFDWSPDGASFVTTLFGNIVQVQADGTIIRWLTDPSVERDPTEGWQLDRLGDSEPVWSPDGTQIAFVREDQSHVADGGSWTNDIFVMNADGSNLRQLTTTGDLKNHPSWSPNGQRIVFSSQGVPPLPVPTDTTSLSSADAELLNQEQQRKTADDIFVINVDGSGLTNLTNSPEHEMTPDWQP